MILEIFEKSRKSMQSYLENDEIINILLSGAFGVGKTTFLETFFLDEEISLEYEVINIQPVDYSILSNQDIFRYIKYDILFEILKRVEIEEEREIIPLLTSLPVYVQYNFVQLMGTLLLLIPKFGKQYFQLFQELSRHKKEFEEIKRKAEKGEFEKINEFAKSFHLDEGELYENNDVTQIISGLLSTMSSKKKVLIIDDLDRIDPSHIFRILNVLSVHYSSRNKFGFDKVVIVCDVDNIRNIFKNKYGQDVDFSGYIDKFYDKEVFRFDNRKKILDSIEVILKSISFIGDNEDHSKYLNNDLRHLKNYAKILFSDLVSNQKINLRSLFKYYEDEISLRSKEITFEYYEKFSNWQLPVVLLIELLVKHFGGVDELITKLDLLISLDTKSSFDKEYKYAIGDALLILGYDTHKLDGFHSDIEHIYTDISSKTRIRYRVTNSSVGHRNRAFYANGIVFLNMNDDQEKETDLPSVYQLWKDCCMRLMKVYDF